MYQCNKCINGKLSQKVTHDQLELRPLLSIIAINARGAYCSGNTGNTCMTR